MNRAALLAAILAAAPTVALSHAEEPPASRTYTLRADPDQAPRLNPLLARVAEPAQALLAHGETPAAFFQRTCAAPPAAYEVKPVGDEVQVTFKPCLRIRRNVKLRALTDARVEGMAVRFGLQPSDYKKLKILPAEGSGRKGPLPATGLLLPGDTVMAPVAPDWTTFTVKTENVADRAALVGLFAQSLECAQRGAEACLVARRVTLAEQAAPAPKQQVVEKPAPEPAPSSPTRSITPAPSSTPTVTAPKPSGGGGLFGFLGRIGAALWPSKPQASPQSIGQTSALAFATDAAALQPPEAPAAPATPLLSVAPEQWPYDPAQVAAVLKDAMARYPGWRQTIVGVADTGLGSRVGAPLPPDMFGGGEAGDNALADGVDDDGNDIIDDLIGSGTPRTALKPVGDVSLCSTGPPNLTDWSDMEAASHGSVVGALAGGYPLRQAYAELKPALPRVLFYRLVKDYCPTDDTVAVDDAELTLGFSYLANRTQIISLSYMSDDTNANGLAGEASRVISGEQYLLLVAAGNRPADLDKDAPCPICMANPKNKVWADARQRIIVVGAAERDLKRMAMSGYGSGTVLLYAPGDAKGAVDVAGRAATFREATSYATPYAAFATALLHSYGLQLDLSSATDVRNRLMLSTWALTNDSTQSSARVIDLLKVAAARHHVVEVKEAAPGGGMVLRDYVGEITSVSGLCQVAVSAKKYQAIRLGEADGDGVRHAVMFRRTLDPLSKELLTFETDCTPTGALTFRPLGSATTRDIPYADVSQILFEWGK